MKRSSLETSSCFRVLWVQGNKCCLIKFNALMGNLKFTIPSCHSFWCKARDSAITFFFLLFQILGGKIYSGPVSAFWMGKGAKNYRKQHWTHDNILKHIVWIWKENCLEEKIFYRKGHFKLLRKSKTGNKSGHYKHILCCIFISTYAVCTI